MDELVALGLVALSALLVFWAFAGGTNTPAASHSGPKEVDMEEAVRQFRLMVRPHLPLCYEVLRYYQQRIKQGRSAGELDQKYHDALREWRPVFGRLCTNLGIYQEPPQVQEVMFVIGTVVLFEPGMAESCGWGEEFVARSQAHVLSLVRAKAARE